MNILTILASVIIVVFSYIYIFKWRNRNKVKKRDFDFSGNKHRFMDISDHIVDHCTV